MSCGGCWLGCAEGKLQCARGVGLSGAQPAGAGQGAEGASASCEYRLHLPAEAQIVRMLQNAVKRMERTPGLQRTLAMRVVGLLAGHGGWMSFGAMRAHEGFPRDEAQAAVGDLRDQGLVDYEGTLAPSTVVRLTERGCAQDAEWRARYNVACAEFASSLDEDERQQLVDLLFKLRG